MARLYLTLWAGEHRDTAASRLLAQSRGQTADYRNFVERYRRMAASLTSQRLFKVRCQPFLRCLPPDLGRLPGD